MNLNWIVRPCLATTRDAVPGAGAGWRGGASETVRLRPGAGWAAGAALVLMCLAGPAARGADAADAADIRRDATVRAVEQVLPSVVNIATKTLVRVRDPFEEMYRRFWGQQSSDSMISLGSGVIIDEAGYLLTNDHVISRADEIQVQLNAGTNVYYRATIVARDPKRDVALLKLDARPGERFHAIKFARGDDLLLGETVLAMGNPFGLGGTVTRGILSSKSRNMPKEGAQLDIPNWLQTDAPINPGNSGGPLVNLRGELIGINVAVLNEYEGQPAQGIGFAIPIRLVEEALSNILPTESVRSFWFGARVKVGTSPLMISSVQAQSPAARAGLKPGDAILQVNGRAPSSFIDFADRLASDAQKPVSFVIQREGGRQETSVQLVPDSSVFNGALVEDKLGLRVEPRTLQLAGRTINALLVARVQKGGPAEAAQVQNGMLITAVDGRNPADVTALAKMLFSKKKGERVRLNLLLIARESDFSVSVKELLAEPEVR